MMAARQNMLALLAVALSGAAAGGCGNSGNAAAPTKPGGDGSYTTALYPKLEQYGMVSIKDGAVVPNEGVVPYELNTPLFSDYAVKFRTLWMPPGTAAAYNESDALDFPVGTIVTKSFGFRDDLRKAAPAVKWVETRVFVRQPAGWKGVSYGWNDAQTSAAINYGGGAVPVSWIDETGSAVSTDYVVPNGNQCTVCHSHHEPGASADTTNLLGPKARNLNRNHLYASGEENQLAHLAAAGMLTGAPADPASQAPRLAVWNDPSTGTTEERARAYLDVNCAHCHSEQGFARTTGLYLGVAQTQWSHLGVCKPPVAVGEATGGFLYDVVPGDPDHSILDHRLTSTEPATMMPQIGRSVSDKQGTQLVRDWITGLKGNAPDCNGR
jgi:uncharacterized repeat protein (TIGR03806 family)